MPTGICGSPILVTTKAIGEITPGGAIKEYEASVTNGANSGAEPFRIALGANGNMWFTDIGSTKAIGEITPSGAIHRVRLLG